jgi:hypothetical protein
MFAECMTLRSLAKTLKAQLVALEQSVAAANLLIIAGPAFLNGITGRGFSFA